MPPSPCRARSHARPPTRTHPPLPALVATTAPHAGSPIGAAALVALANGVPTSLCRRLEDQHDRIHNLIGEQHSSRRLLLVLC